MKWPFKLNKLVDTKFVTRELQELNKIIGWRLTQNFELVNGMAQKFEAWDSILRQIDRNVNEIADQLKTNTVKVAGFVKPKKKITRRKKK